MTILWMGKPFREKSIRRWNSEQSRCRFLNRPPFRVQKRKSWFAGEFRPPDSRFGWALPFREKYFGRKKSPWMGAPFREKVSGAGIPSKVVAVPETGSNSGCRSVKAGLLTSSGLQTCASVWRNHSGKNISAGKKSPWMTFPWMGAPFREKVSGAGIPSKVVAVPETGRNSGCRSVKAGLTSTWRP